MRSNLIYYPLKEGVNFLSMRHYSPYLLPDAPSFVTRVPRFEFIFFIVSLGKRGVRRAVNLLKRSDGCLVCK